MNPAAAIEEAKRSLRDAMRRRLATLSAEQCASDSSHIRRQLAMAPGWRHAAFRMGYAALPSEPDVLIALVEAANEGRTVTLPRWNEGSGTYEAAVLPGDGRLVRGPFGVMEPPQGSPVVALERLDLVVVPGLAFDRCGRRLGRGKGFFDRLLTRAWQARRWGVAFGLQVVDEVPFAPHDVNVDLLVTPGSWLPMTARGST